MPVEAVVRGVQLAVMEPAKERRLRFVEHLGEGLRPGKRLAPEARPEAFEIALGLRDELAIGLHAGEVRLLDERWRGRKDPLLLQHRFNGRARRHAPPPCSIAVTRIQSPNYHPVKPTAIAPLERAKPADLMTT